VKIDDAMGENTGKGTGAKITLLPKSRSECGWLLKGGIWQNLANGSRAVSFRIAFQSARNKLSYETAQ
jgi:hypothetical protein